MELATELGHADLFPRARPLGGPAPTIDLAHANVLATRTLSVAGDRRAAITVEEAGRPGVPRKLPGGTADFAHTPVRVELT